MRDIRRYWKEVRALEASLPEFVWLVDVEGSAPVEVERGGRRSCCWRNRTGWRAKTS